MNPLEYRSRHGRVTVDDTGIEVIGYGGGDGLFLPWHSIGHMYLSGLGRRTQRARIIRLRITDGRTVPLPAPVAGRWRSRAFNRASDEIFRVWRQYARIRLEPPQDEIPRGLR
ncbi:hypothetical protein [Actinospica robiniae]|uniref:hypothetical protein n=1 Tax=Actinospica robiniae TaxID=304901 RepID=UPI000400C1A7|nr:hypothetical protein [Actinospica robiniae]